MDIWDIYFAGLAGWSMHPAYFREPEFGGSTVQPMSLEECAEMADDMLAIRNKRFPNEFAVYGPDGKLKVIK